MSRTSQVSCRNMLRDRSGSTLSIVIILSFVMLITLAAVFQIGVQDAGLAARNEESVQALFLAEAGLSEGVSWLHAQPTPPPGVSQLEPFGADPETLACGYYSVTITPDMANPGQSRKLYTVTSTGVSNGKSRTLTREVSTRSFAQFIYFTDLEMNPGSGSPIWFASADYLSGPVHTNGHIHIMGDPYFGGHVTSAWGGPGDTDPSHNPSLVYHNSGWSFESTAPSNAPYDEPTFAAGYELGAGYIDFPEYLDDLKVLAQDGGIYVEGNTKVQFAREVSGSPLHGYVSYKPYRGGTWTDVPLSSINGVIYVKGNMQLWGTVDGVATVSASRDIIITDDIVYRDAHAVNGPNPGCDDVLGIVSQDDIIIDNNTANQSDCNIHAHMMALDTSFMVEDYNVGSPRGTLTVHGGIIQKYRGPVGTGYVSGHTVHINTGYAKNYNYDARFYNTAPPGYLSTGTYELLAWNEVPCGS